METKSKVNSELVAVTIAVLLAAYFAASAFAACARYEPSPPTDPDNPVDVVSTNGDLLLSRIMLPDHGFRSEDGCNGSSCNGTNPCCSGCICLPIPGRVEGFCLGICCLV
ncbi:hypothetical protein TIFTF001_029695 [Ficus carica]|uniref:Uncharacterized protein n=1 Tax=Ficus carica TaxID=3494 RepID=A0AA88J1T8_FICCA|nr:hypothetical protein TIFTF001_029695 [Ficus carica]